MNRADRSAAPNESERETSFLSPLAAFLILLTLLLVVGGFLSRLPFAAPSAAEREHAEHVAPSQADVLDEFRRLHRTYREASRRRDGALLHDFLAPGSPVHAAAIEDINQLRNDKVLDRSSFRTLDLRIVALSRTAATLEQVVDITPRFVSEDGERLRSSGKMRQTVSWTLHLVRGAWRVFDIQVDESQDLN